MEKISLEHSVTAVLLCAVFFCVTASAWAAATLENPAPSALKSGVGVISGWVCGADELTVSFDGGPQTFVPYGSERIDTAGVCGDTDNGFGLLWNYNNLGDGPHTVTLYADGTIQTQVNFNVTTLGTDFLRGVTGQGTVALSDGKQVNVQWEETTQGFTITGYSEGGDTQSIGDAQVELEKLLGAWDMTVYLPTFDVFVTDTHTFDRLFVSIDGIQSLEGTVDFTYVTDGPDTDSVTMLTRDFLADHPASALRQYTYRTYHETGLGGCYADFFTLTSPTTFVGVSYGGRETPDGCDYYDESPNDMSGIRIRSPQ